MMGAMGAIRIWGESPGYGPHLLDPDLEAQWRLGRRYTFAFVTLVQALPQTPYLPGPRPSCIVLVRGRRLELAWSGMTDNGERGTWGGRTNQEPTHGPLLILPKQGKATFESGLSGVHAVLLQENQHYDLFLWEDLRVWLLRAVGMRARKRSTMDLGPSPVRPPPRNGRLALKTAPHALGEVFPHLAPVTAGPF